MIKILMSIKFMIYDINMFKLSELILVLLINPFPANIPIMEKPGSWFLLAKCHSSIGVFTHFASKNQLPGFSISGALA